MQTLSGFPYFEVQFDKRGDVFDAGEVEALVRGLAEGGATDLFAIAHGWNNNMEEARALYAGFFAQVRRVLDSAPPPGLANRRFAVLGVLWPSKKFADRDLIASGAASAASAIDTDTLRAMLADLRALLDDPAADAALDQAAAHVPHLDDSRAAREAFADLVRSALAQSGGAAPPSAEQGEDAAASFFDLPGGELLDRLGKPVMPAPPARGGAGSGSGTAGGVTGGAASVGAAAGIGAVFGGIRAGARNLLNLATYYQMKERAGVVGQRGVSDTLRAARAAAPGLKIHLIGHSFGGRLMTAAAASSGRADSGAAGRPASLTLLQAAFSHHGFAQRYDGRQDGFFRAVASEGLVAGPILVTHTANDRVVGLAYPLASLVARQQAAGLGDRNDLYGGIGRNGARKTPEATDGVLLPVGQPYAFQAGRLYNLNADGVMSGHSDVEKAEVAYAVLSAAAGGRSG